jgi:enoyl-[acyl-carrier protein] reductase/trans-2-enoyl-CoA reductase (NAD+)
MKLAIPSFQFRFVPSMGNVVFPGNFHPVGTQAAAEAMLERVGSPEAPTGENWLVVGGSGGFGSAARAVLGGRYGANTLNVSLDAQPTPESNNKIRKIGSPGFHRNMALERGLSQRGTVAGSIIGDAFDPAIRDEVVATVRERFQGKINGLVWALAAPRAKDPRTGKTIASALKPLGKSLTVKTFTGRDARSGKEPEVVELELPPGSPEEAISTVFVMGGGIVRQWIDVLMAADVLAEGFTLYTISYRGNPLNAGMYREGLIGLAKADLEFETAALDAQLKERVGGKALAVEGPAVVTEASGGIPGVPFYLAHMLDVMGDAFEDPLASMQRMFAGHFSEAGLATDDAGLVRMDDVELQDTFQSQLQARYDAAPVGSTFDGGLYDRFMSAYAQTRGFDIPGVDYEAEFDTREVCGLPPEA